MLAKMTSAFVVLAALAVVALAVPFPESSPAENPLRTINRDEECRPGLCPHIRRLVPDLSQAPPHHIQGLARNQFVGEPSLCGNLCVHDKACASHQKCCPTTCGYACQDTVFIHDESEEYNY
ncbi:WAP four-disulfide core domain protein 18-like [Thrips palmi]|uniref:WAP four-disulfide core domain protein 18-like n=1 Tax=Thrips palmi TaxID=161013 RepID=A0A6P8Y7P0_THRPL|nr:WAP four-disulfide core domain protein 18-like [Thrips palmi]